MSKFEEVTIAIQELSKGYDEIDPQTRDIFLDTLSTYVGIIQELHEGKYENISSNDVKMSIFENVFDVDLKVEFEKMVTLVVEARADGSMESSQEDADIKNADVDLLANIRSNIDEYLKD